MPNRTPQTPPRAGRGRLSRPARIHDLEAATRELAEEYQAWLDALPENLAEGEMADQLTEIIAQLEEITEGFAILAGDPLRSRGWAVSGTVSIDPPVIGARRQAAQGETP